MRAKLLQSCLTLCNTMDCITCQAPPSMGFSRKEYWSELPFPSPGDLPHAGIEPGLLYCRQIALQADSKDTIWTMREARKVAVKVWSIEPQRSVSLDSGNLWDQNYFHNNSFLGASFIILTFAPIVQRQGWRKPLEFSRSEGSKNLRQH